MTGDVIIDYQNYPKLEGSPVPGAAKVWWRIDGFWVQKGWLIPPRGGFHNE